MPQIYVAASKNLAAWGASVGIGKSLFKVGLAATGGKKAVATLNAEEHAGFADWTLVKAEDAGELIEAEAMERIAAKEKQVDAKYYPRLRGAGGIFRVKPDNVENAVLLRRALAGEAKLDIKIKPTDAAAYLINCARG